MAGGDIVRTSAGGIIVGRDGRVVIVHQHKNSWSLPKGGVEAGETPLDAAKREIHEETGIADLTLVGELGSYERYAVGKDGIGENKEWGLRKLIFFLFKTQETHLQSHDAEITEARFVTLDEAGQMLSHPKDREFFHSVRDKITS